MCSKHPSGPPMDLANMRRQGVRSLIAYCLNDACRHQGIIDVPSYPGDMIAVTTRATRWGVPNKRAQLSLRPEFRPAKHGGLGDGMEWPDGSLLIPTHRAVIR